MSTTAATETKAGFSLPCPHCGSTDGDLVVQLDEMTVRCLACDETVTRADLKAMVADAQRLLRWLDMAATA